MSEYVVCRSTHDNEIGGCQAFFALSQCCYRTLGSVSLNSYTSPRCYGLWTCTKNPGRSLIIVQVIKSLENPFYLGFINDS